MREEDKAIVDKEMKRLCYMGILKEGFSAYSSPVMLISRKLTKDKRVVTDFRDLNVRIAKNNLAYPLVRDIFSVLGQIRQGDFIYILIQANLQLVVHYTKYRVVNPN